MPGLGADGRWTTRNCWSSGRPTWNGCGSRERRLDTRFGYANEVASLFGSNRPAARELLSLWLRWWRDLLLVKEGADEYLHNADHADALRAHAETLTTAQIAAFIRRLLDTMAALDANVSPRLAMETLMLNVE